MDPAALDTLARHLHLTANRRRVSALLAGLAILGGNAAAPAAGAKGKQKCRKPKRQCGKACVNPKVSNAHCGKCNHRCAAGETCTQGRCVDANPGQCATTCPSGCCNAGSDSCQPGFQPSACGSDGRTCRVCASGQSCVEGACCVGDSKACDNDGDCCGSKSCDRGGCCTQNGESPSTIQPRCCAEQDIVQFSRCCRPLQEACEEGETCCAGTCNDDRCCYARGRECERERDDQCCSGLACAPVFADGGGSIGILCCSPRLASCTVNTDCCGEADCYHGVCTYCPPPRVHCSNQDGEWCCPEGQTCGPREGPACLGG